MTQGFPAIFWLIVKILTIVGLIIYTIFAVVMVRQERLMAGVIEEGFEPVLRILTIIHLLLALIVLASAVIFL